MRTTSQMRQLWAPACGRRTIRLLMHSGAAIVVAVETVDAWKALDRIMYLFGYHPRVADTAGEVCRQITGGAGYSLHAYAIAVDFNWRTNPYGRVLITDMPRGMVEAIEAIRTNRGARVFRWGGDWDDDNVRDDVVYDAMHFEIQASPYELSFGIDQNTIPFGNTKPATPGPTPGPAIGGRVNVDITLPRLALGDKGDDVRKLQRIMRDFANQKGMRVDGGFGPSTKEAVIAIQKFFNIRGEGKAAGDKTFTGIVGRRTWRVLLAAAFPTD